MPVGAPKKKTNAAQHFLSSKRGQTMCVRGWKQSAGLFVVFEYPKETWKFNNWPWPTGLSQHSWTNPCDYLNPDVHWLQFHCGKMSGPAFPKVTSEKCGFTRQHLTIGGELMPRTRHSVPQHVHLAHWSTRHCRTSFCRWYDLGGSRTGAKTGIIRCITM